MKRVAVAVALSGMMMVPGVAAAGASTDAALGLGAFAVFNQILSGTGVFGGGHTVVVERPVVVAPPPPPRVIYAPPPPAVVYHAPRAVYAPAPVYVVPGHGHGHGHGKHWKKHRGHHHRH